MTYFYRYIFLFASLLNFSTVLAQDTLYLYDPLDKTVVKDAYVRILDASLAEKVLSPFFADSKGRVIIDSFSTGDYLLIEHINYHRIQLNWFEVKTLKGKINLDRRALDLIEVVVYGSSKTDESVKDVPNQITIIDKEEIRLYNPQTTADALSNSGDVFVQKSQMGGGSPILRGFEANRVLLVLDGIRMNNAIYRTGHLQNVITIDPSMLDRIEVFYGPGTVMYGSDGMGGVLYFSTKKPVLKTVDLNPFSANAYTRFSTANFEKTAHVDFNLGTEKFASLTSITYSNFDDLRSGRIKSDTNMARYWNRYFYAERQNDVDVVRVNSNPNVQVGTAYAQMDILQKFRFKPNEKADFIVNLQYSTSSNVPRYDQLTEGSVDFINGQIISQKLDFAEWDYGPQNRLLTSFHANIRPDQKTLFNTANITAAFQKIDEDRITRLFGDPLRRVQSEDVYVYTLNADLVKKISKNMNLLYGAEATHNIVSSRSKTINIETEEQSERGLATRYPDGGSTMSTAASYLNYRWKIHDRINLIAGGRYSFTHIGANYIDTALYDLPYDNIKIPTNAITGSISMAADLGSGFQLNTILSNAFRAPNVDDIAKLRAKGRTVSVPNPDVGPEQGINTEITINKQFARKFKLSATYFHTFLSNVLVQDFYTIGGVDTMYYDGRFRQITTLVNAGKARIWGLHGSMAFELNQSAFVKGSITYTRGRNVTDQGLEPLSHIPPLYGQFSFHYTKNQFNFTLMSRFNGPKLLKDYSGDSEENFDKALPEGTPGWFVINVYTAYNINEMFSLNIGLENLLDWHYRPYSSGVSAPGQNIILTLRGSF